MDSKSSDYSRGADATHVELETRKLRWFRAATAWACLKRDRLSKPEANAKRYKLVPASKSKRAVVCTTQTPSNRLSAPTIERPLHFEWRADIAALRAPQ